MARESGAVRGYVMRRISEGERAWVRKWLDEHPGGELIRAVAEYVKGREAKEGGDIPGGG